MRIKDLVAQIDDYRALMDRIQSLRAKLGIGHIGTASQLDKTDWNIDHAMNSKELEKARPDLQKLLDALIAQADSLNTDSIK